MKMKLMRAALLAAGLIAAGGMAPAAHAQSSGDGWGRENRELRRDDREIRQDRAELREDYRELARDRADYARARAEGNLGAMRRERAEIRRDEAEIRRDRAELHHDLRQREHDRREQTRNLAFSNHRGHGGGRVQALDTRHERFDRHVEPDGTAHAAGSRTHVKWPSGSLRSASTGANAIAPDNSHTRVPGNWPANRGMAQRG